MPLVLADRVRDTTTTTGTGTITLSGTAPTGYQNFSVIGNGNTTYYTINAGSQWEVGIGTYSSTGPTLARTTVLESSNGGALVDFVAGVKDVFVTYPADKSVNYDENNNVGIGTTSVNLASGRGMQINAPAGQDTRLKLTNVDSGTGSFDGFDLGVAVTGAVNLIGWEAQPMSFYTSGTERMRITSAGNVGIGTTSPGARLDVSDAGTGFVSFAPANASTSLVMRLGYATDFSQITADNFGGNLLIGADESNTKTNSFIAFRTDATERMRIDASGNLLVGTTTAVDNNFPLELNAGASGLRGMGVNNNGGYGVYLTYDNTGRYGTGGAAVRNIANSPLAFETNNTERARITAAGGLAVGTTTDPGAGNILISGTKSYFAYTNDYGIGTPDFNGLQIFTSNGDSMRFGHRTGGTTFTERMRLDTGGNLGIGTSSPAERLAVAGNVQATQGTYCFTGVTSGTVQGQLAANEGGAAVQLRAVSNHPLAFFTNNTERMRLNSAGHLGLGVTPSASTEPLLQMQNGGMLATAGPYAHYMANAFFGAGGWTYTTSAAATRYEQGVGIHSWHTAPSGTAGNAITFTQAMTLDTQTAGRSTLTLNNSSQSLLSMAVGGSRRGYLLQTSTEMSLFNEANGALFFGTNAAERMRIDSIGNVGIGTSSPGGSANDRQLTLVGSSSAQATFGAGGVANSVGATTSLAYLGPTSNHPLGFYTNNTERMRVTAAGDVGIGTTAPSARLEAFGTDASIIVHNSGNSRGGIAALNTQRLAFASTAAADDLVFGYAASPITSASFVEHMRIDNGTGNVGIGTSSPSTRLTVADGAITAGASSDVLIGRFNTTFPTSGAGYFRLRTNNVDAVNGGISFDGLSSGTLVERMRIDGNGNVGIGTASPAYRLDIAGADAAFRATSANAYGDFTNGTGTLRLQVSGPDGFITQTNAGSLVLRTNATERMRIDASGNVGIGTSSPAAPLQVVGAGRFGAGPGDATNATLAMYNDGTGVSIEAFQGNNAGVKRNLWLNAYGGNVGIGTSSPGQRLEVSGSIAVTGGGNIFSNSTASTWGIAGGNAFNNGGGITVGGSTSSVIAGGIYFSTGTGATNSERMRIDSTGLVGIGTTTPGLYPYGGLLNVAGGISMALGNRLGWGITDSFTLNGVTTAHYGFTYGGGSNFVTASGYYGINFATLGADRMRITSSGNVTIGNSAVDTAALSIARNTSTATVAASSSIVLSNRNTGINGTIAGGIFMDTFRDVADPHYSGGIWFTRNPLVSNLTSSSDIVFGSSGFNTSGALPAEIMRLTATGNLGIGTTAPSARLHAVVSSSGNTLPGNAIGIFESNANNVIAISAPAANAAGVFFPRSTVAYYAGIERSDTNLVFKNNDAERMRIDSAGNMLLGTTVNNFGSRMEITATGLTNLLSLYNTTVGGGAKIRFLDGSSNAGVGNVGGNLIFYAEGADTERARINISGNFGIGTSSPNARLAVQAAVGSFFTSLINASETEFALRAFNHGSTVGPVTFTHGLYYADTENTAIKFYRGGSSVGGFMAFTTDNGTERMRLDSSGRLGIGTTAPSYLLTVAGAGNAGACTIALVDTSASNKEWRIDQSSGSLRFTESGVAERMLINSSGNVGIGTSSPGNRLHVVGNIQLNTTSDTMFTNNIAVMSSAADMLLNASSAAIRFNAGGTERMRIAATGSVQINSVTGANPSLFVYDNDTTDAGVIIRQDGTAPIQIWQGLGGAERMRITSDGELWVRTNTGVYSAANRGLISVGGSSSSLLFLGTGGNTGTYLLHEQASGGAEIWNGANGFLRFATNNTERVRINSSGNLLVGTTSNPDSSQMVVSGGSITHVSTQLNTRPGAGVNYELVNRNGAGFDFYVNNASNLAFRITSTGAITSSDLADAVGYKGIPQNARTSAYTLALSDIGRHISITTGGVTIPANGSVAFPIGSAITIYNNSASNQTISITSDTLRLAGTATTGSRTLAQRGICTCVKVAATEWVISGAGLT